MFQVNGQYNIVQNFGKYNYYTKFFYIWSIWKKGEKLIFKKAALKFL